VAIVDRMIKGAFIARGLPADACTIAAVEIGVPVWALDIETMTGRPGIRVAEPGELVGRGRDAAPAPAGCLALADERRLIAPLMTDPGPGCAPGRRSRGIVLIAVSVPGAPQTTVDEALWLAADHASETRF
jgi:hypothetical protein